jgi:hypothetical protein
MKIDDKDDLDPARGIVFGLGIMAGVYAIALVLWVAFR